jgi:hypothetical protein
MTNESTQLNVLISGGFAGAYEQLLPEFQRMSGGEQLVGLAPSTPATPCAGSSAIPRVARARPGKVHILVKPTRPDIYGASHMAQCGECAVVVDRPVRQARNPFKAPIRWHHG